MARARQSSPKNGQSTSSTPRGPEGTVRRIGISLSPFTVHRSLLSTYAGRRDAATALRCGRCRCGLDLPEPKMLWPFDFPRSFVRLHELLATPVRNQIPGDLASPAAGLSERGTGS